MKRNHWASLALASSLVWASGCCCNLFDGCSSSHFGGGMIARGSHSAPVPCECSPGYGAGLAGGPTISGGHVITGDGPTLTSPIITPGAPGQPPRIVPVPQANPIPYTP